MKTFGYVKKTIVILALAAFILVLLVAMLFYEFDTYFEIKARLTLDERNLVITSDQDGIIFLKKNYHNGQVSKHDIVMVLAATDLYPQIELTTTHLQAISAAIDRASNQLANQPLVFSSFSQGNFEAINHQTHIFNKQTRIHQQQLNEIERTLHFITDELHLLEHLERNGIVTRMQPHTLHRQIRLLTQEKQTIQEAYRQQLRQELTSLTRSEKALEKALNQIIEHLFTQAIRSPIDGVISEFMVREPGTPIKNKQPLIVLSLTDSQFIAVVHVAHENLTRLEDGLTVEMTLPTTGFWRRTKIQGTIQHVINIESIQTEKGQHQHALKLYIKMDPQSREKIGPAYTLSNHTNINVKIYLDRL